MIINVDDLRKQGIALLTLVGWGVVFALGILSVEHGQYALIATSISSLINLIPTWYALRGSSGKQARLNIGLVTALQPCLVAYAMQGSPWQFDMHLYFFVALALLTSLWDIRAIITAAGIFILHHLIASLSAPEIMFQGGNNLVMALIHISAIIMVAASLCYISLWFTTLMQTNTDLVELNDEQVKELKETRISLSENFAKFEAERDAAAQKQAERELMCKSELAAVAARFEQSIAAIVQSVAKSVKGLEQMAKALRTIAAETDKEARDVASSAQGASKASKTIAAGVAELKHSISKIASDIGQQNQLATKVTRRSGDANQELGTPCKQSQIIAEATSEIARITNEANAQSLNATIEAAIDSNVCGGFAAAAQEVKALAAQASEAATQIDTFLSGMSTDTAGVEIDIQTTRSAITSLDKMARSIRYEVESHRRSADTIATFARNASGDTDTMARQSNSISKRTKAAIILSDEFEQAIEILRSNFRELDRITSDFKTSLKAA